MAGLSPQQLLADGARWALPYDSGAEWLGEELARARLLLEHAIGQGGEGAWIQTSDGELSAEAGAERLGALITGRLGHTSGRRLGSLLAPFNTLGDADRLLLGWLIGAELDAHISGLVEQMQGQTVGSGVSLLVLADLLSDDLAGRVTVLRDVLGANAPVRRLGLAVLGPAPKGGGAGAFTLRVTRTALAALLGAVPDPVVDHLSALLPPTAEAAGMAFPSSVTDPFWRTYPDTASPIEQVWPVALVTGPLGVGKSALVAHIASALGRPVRQVLGDRLADYPYPRDALSRIEESAAAAEEFVHFDTAPRIAGRKSPIRHELCRVLDRRRVPVIIEAQRQSDLDPEVLDRVDIVCRLHAPTASERERVLRSLVPSDVTVPDGAEMGLVGSRFNIAPRALKRVASLAVQMARHRNPEAPVLDTAELTDLAIMQLRGDLGELAERRPPGPTLSDLILPDITQRQIDEVIAACRVRSRVLSHWGFGKRLSKGRGLCLLFHGVPGTGKTHCAEVLSRELELELYQVSLPKIVSKWVGETERNIDRIFSAARMSQAVLLFDEADSLFANRTEVRSANDRYANMETNYLLQQIEHYDGVVVLTTNFIKNLDAAAERRIAYRVEFPFPDAAARGRIWRSLIPPEASLSADVDFRALGRDYELAGGYIKNTVLRAACRAMAADTVLDMRSLAGAAETECRLAGRMVRTRPSG